MKVVTVLGLLLKFRWAECAISTNVKLIQQQEILIMSYIDQLVIVIDTPTLIHIVLFINMILSMDFVNKYELKSNCWII